MPKSKEERIKRLMEEKKEKAKKVKEYKAIPTMAKSKNTITSKGVRRFSKLYTRKKKT